MRLFKASQFAQYRPKSVRKSIPQAFPKRVHNDPGLQTSKIKKNATLPYENLIFDVHRPSNIVPKSMQKRLQNQLHVACPLGTLQNTIFDVKTSPRWTPKISVFFQKSTKKSSYYGLWSKMPLGSLQEPPKSLPRASQEPFQGPQEAPKSTQEPSQKLPRGVQEPSRGT